MNPLYFGLFCVVLGIVMSILGSVLKKKRAGSAKYQQLIADFQQSVNSMLEEGEVVEAMCGYKPCAAVTSKRLLVSSKTGIDAVAFSEIKSLKGLNASGNKTKDPSRMLVFEIKAAKKYTLGNHSEGFDQVVHSLVRHTGL